MSLMMGQDLLVNAIAITELHSIFDQKFDLIVVGGGASGFMGAIVAAEAGVNSVLVIESTSKVLDKVRISGGGRCNVTHACWELKDLVEYYPRGRLPLLGPFSRFSTQDAVSWFENKGLQLHIEEDGRMFPSSNSSLEVVSCLTDAAKKLGVKCLKKNQVSKVTRTKHNSFKVNSKNGESFETKNVLLATGGNSKSRKLVEIFGHTIINPVPSLFSINLDSEFLSGCAGIALDNITLSLSIRGKKFIEKGRILITHNGITGPAALRLSSFAARELYADKYKGKLTIGWVDNNFEGVKSMVRQFRYQKARSTILNARPYEVLPKRLWHAILMHLKINPLIKWSEITIENENKLSFELVKSSYSILGKGPFGEEFVTAGGIDLKEVDLSNMESRLCPGLYFAGEILDIDGVTGGFNFQHCWTSGWLAGNSIARNL